MNVADRARRLCSEKRSDPQQTNSDTRTAGTRVRIRGGGRDSQAASREGDEKQAQLWRVEWLEGRLDRYPHLPWSTDEHLQGCLTPEDEIHGTIDRGGGA
ncbi:hypothetical protein NDU88_003333 [Pleurodeles waltl]|uniref:Uncharacterized protein n=1 Tax=Pleurodeles waltl TaxID=8319 RepID=A0AAV7L3N2_PLEWA|nr:hypothetical protein NDU88_003333 [Pleurodeles waltl]